MEQNKKIKVYIDEAGKFEYMKLTAIEQSTNKINYSIEEKFDIGKIASLLSCFIEYDLSKYSHYIFKYYGFEILLTENERKEIENVYISSKEDLEEVLDKKLDEIYGRYKEELEYYKLQIVDIIQYCLFNEKEELKDLKPIERFEIFINTKSIEKYPILNHNKFNKYIDLTIFYDNLKEKELINYVKCKYDKPYLAKNIFDLKEIYEIDNFYDLLFLELYLVLQEKIYLKKCQNCGKYFVTPNSAVIYCNNIFEKGKTCKDIGASKVFSKNLEKDEAYTLYRKVYKKKQAIAKSKGGDFDFQYKLFKIEGKDMKNAYKLGEISKEEFIKWINEQ